MLEALRITNYAIIDELDIQFSPGLTVITGETGAGKSIVLGAFRVLLGDRATSDMIRSGCARAGIEGTLSGISGDALSWINTHGFQGEDDDPVNVLLLRRDLLASGTSRNFINGMSATVTQLKELGLLLVDMHGQNDHSRLNSTSAQLQVLDNFGSYGKQLESYREAFQQWHDARVEFDRLSIDRGDEQRRKDFLEFQVQEIEQAELMAGEDADLDGERKRLVNAERLREISANVRNLLYEGEGEVLPAGTQVGLAGKMLQELSGLDEDQLKLAEEAESIRFALEDLSERIRDYSDNLVGDPERLDQVETRLELIRDLKRKYGSTLDEIIATGQQLATELGEIVNHDAALAEAEAVLASTEKTAASKATELTEARKKAAGTFEKQIEPAMRDLELPKARLQIRLESTLGNSNHPGDRPSFGANGQDTCEFLVCLNAGEDLKPLRKVASGGEVSRIMLAIKSVLAKRDQVPTLVFDEIDTGISGEAAARVGDRLENLSASHQVICITHLPQVAARGAMHLVIEKSTKKSRTTTTVTAVEGEERTMALARMLSGTKVDDTTKRFAEKLLVRP